MDLEGIMPANAEDCTKKIHIPERVTKGALSEKLAVALQVSISSQSDTSAVYRFLCYASSDIIDG